MIVQWAKGYFGLGDEATREARLFSVGSVLSFAADGDTVWGSGVNGKVPPEDHNFFRLDVRALRGPLSYEFLRGLGIPLSRVPYGDPALLLGRARPDLCGLKPEFPVTVVTNMYDLPPENTRCAIDPRSPVEQVLQRVAHSELVVGSSLHAIIVAEALGIPARVVRSETEPEFKYADYYRGTGRDLFEFATSVSDAIAAGGLAPPRWDPEPLIDAFPRDLWLAS
jgi:pyruvyltransferase